jgi:hypothetical protein
LDCSSPLELFNPSKNHVTVSRETIGRGVASSLWLDLSARNVDTSTEKNDVFSYLTPLTVALGLIRIPPH